ncbi:MAG: twin-arginine translocase subunit TatC [Rickettsiales bacterium]|jgi:sec-independent protein translocase protein TatC|nr:twin-arginine translocase subunit TatC [Rickettsiales bacterium]
MQKMTLMQHFRELKNRVIWSMLFFAVAFGVGFYFVPDLQAAVMTPLLDVWANPKMIYTGIADGLGIEFSLAGLFALLLSAPFWLWQTWRYVSPALKKDEKKIAVPILLLSPALFVAGAVFAYYILLPIMFRFFLDIGVAGVEMMPNMKDYLSFSIEILKAFGLAFQLPLLLVLLNRAHVFSRGQILAACRYIVIAIFVVAAALTPPDIISQIALALPLCALFGLSFLFMI